MAEQPDSDPKPPVSCTVEEGVAVIRIDDGRVNVLSHAVIGDLHAGLDTALAEATAVTVIGREGKLSAGFDLNEMTAGVDRARALVQAGGELLMRIFTHPQPVAVAVTGHALAAGALLTLACDTRIGADGPYKIGLNETAIGMGLPRYAHELATARLAPTHLTRAALQAEIYDPEGAREAGYLDQVVSAADCAETAIAEARRLGEYRSGAYAHTKALQRQAIADRVLADLADDMASITAPGS
jgi:enoyl-CoA hydratase